MASAHLKYISRMMISEFNYLNINQNGGGKIVAFFANISSEYALETFSTCDMYIKSGQLFR